MDEHEEEDERVITRVGQLAEEFKLTTDAGLVKKLSKDMSPSQTSLRKPVGSKEAANYYTY